MRNMNLKRSVRHQVVAMEDSYLDSNLSYNNKKIKKKKVRGKFGQLTIKKLLI